MAVSTQRLAVNKGLGDSIDDHFTRASKKPCADRGGSDLHEDHVIEADRLKAFSSAITPCISWALIIASSTVFMRRGSLPLAIRVRESQSAVARIPPRLSDGWPHSAASHVSLKSSQRTIAPMLKAA